MTERLSVADASFLGQREPEYLSGLRLLVFEGPAPGFEAFLEHVRRRLPTEPRLRQRVRRDRLELRRPRWETDPNFDLRRHVRSMPLPTDPRRSALESLSEVLLGRPVDLDHPLWELCYVEGFRDEGFAVGVRLHHAMCDGNASAILLTRLFPPVGEASTDGLETLAGRSRTPSRDRWAQAAPTVVRWRPGSIRPRRVYRRVRRGVNRLGIPLALGRQHTAPAPRSSLNRGPVGVGRDVGLASAPLGELRLARKALETTVNSLVVAAVAGGLRRHLQRLGWPTNDLVGLIPVSLWETPGRGVGNQVASILCPLPLGEPEPGRRLGIVTDAVSAAVGTARAAENRRELAGPQFWRDYLARRYGKGLFNVLITNTPGPTVPLACCGRSAVLHLASGPNIQFEGPVIRVSSYLDELTIAATTSSIQPPDSAALARDIHASLQELQGLAHGTAADAGQPPRAGQLPTE